MKDFVLESGQSYDEEAWALLKKRFESDEMARVVNLMGLNLRAHDGFH